MHIPYLKSLLKEYAKNKWVSCNSNLLTDNEFADFAGKKSVSCFSRKNISKFWQIGLLRADYISSFTPLKYNNIELVDQNDGKYFYADLRRPQKFHSGLGSVFQTLPTVPNSVQLHFHKYKLYPLYHIFRIFRPIVHWTQYMASSEALVRLQKNEIAHFDDWTSSEQCVDRFHHWNRVSELASLFNLYFENFPVNAWFSDSEIEVIKHDRRKFSYKLCHLLRRVSLQTINDVREELGREAQIIDGNKRVQVLIRLMSETEKRQIEGHLGASTLFLDMAESIRRPIEIERQKSLPEEDEIGFGTWAQGARELLYGSNRIFDQQYKFANEYLNKLGIVSGIQVRCYVEGETEYSAFKSATADIHGIEIINLRGNFVEKNTKNLSFSESLKNDINSQIFSILVLDSDRNDNTRAVKIAARNGQFFGLFFIAKNDFETENFSTIELAQIVKDLLRPDSYDAKAYNNLLQEIKSINSAKKLFSILKANNFSHLTKGKQWGESLIEYAKKYPVKENGDERQCIKVLQYLLRARRGSYLITYKKYKTCAETGLLIDRN